MKIDPKTTARRPYVIGTLSGRKSIKTQIRSAKAASVDLIEIRLDTFPLNSHFIEIVSYLRKKFRKGILLTFRAAGEGGQIKLSDENRLALLTPLIPYCDWVDAEISRSWFVGKLSQLAHKKRKKIVHSYHNFKKVPPIPFLDELKKKSNKLKGDFLKVAVKPHSDVELLRFLKWGMDVRPKPILIGMGHIGSLSRFVGYSFGSHATYGHLGQAALLGQPSARQLVKSIQNIYG